MKDPGAAVITVGSELLIAGRRDGNADWLAERLQRLGCRVRMACRVGDGESEIADLVRAAAGRCETVIVTGGLGPTEDDRTRAAIASALEAPLVRDPAQVEALRNRFAEKGRPFLPLQHKQADKPEGTDWLPNPLGTAPGFVREERILLAVLPGVPQEMKAMFDGQVAPRIAARTASCLCHRTLKIAGRTESSVDAQLGDLYDSTGVHVTILSGVRGLEIRILAQGSSEEQALSRLAAADDAMSERLGLDLFGRDDDTLPEIVGAALREEGRTLATAESCTAGLLAGAVTSVPGSSAWYRGGLVVYHDDLKESLAAVGGDTIRRHGAVSPEVAAELARGARASCRADLGLGITGIAGPSGGSADKPVGLVHLVLDDGARSTVRELRLPGDREQVRGRTVTAGLDLIRRYLARGEIR